MILDKYCTIVHKNIPAHVDAPVYFYTFIICFSKFEMYTFRT